MGLIILGAVFLAAPFLIAGYLRHAARGVRRSGHAWEKVEQHARVLLEDRRLAPEAGDMIEFLIERIGSGMLTGVFLFCLVSSGRRGTAKSETVLSALNREQEDQFLRFMAAAVLYDSLRSPILGAILRRIVYWLAPTATDKTAPISRYEVEPMVVAAGRLSHA